MEAPAGARAVVRMAAEEKAAGDSAEAGSAEVDSAEAPGADLVVVGMVAEGREACSVENQEVLPAEASREAARREVLLEVVKEEGEGQQAATAGQSRKTRRE